jgi:hypothetical protein
MPGASAETRQIKNLNANWHPDDRDGRFELQVITDDDQQFTMPASPAALSGIVAMVRADAVLAWDPVNATLIAANIVGQMPWTISPANG